MHSDRHRGILLDMANSEPSDPGARLLRGASPSEQLRTASFPIVMRGYDRRAVDDFLDELRTLVADLEAGQTREGVVQKALDEIGEETAGSSSARTKPPTRSPHARARRPTRASSAHSARPRSRAARPTSTPSRWWWTPAPCGRTASG